MNTLFPIDPDFPEGFSYVRDFISAEEEKYLLQTISKIELHPMLFQGYEAKRKVASFGHEWSFEKRILSKGREIPHAFDALIEKVSKQLLIAPDAFVELLVTEYPAGAVLSWHRDAPPFDLIAGLSLLSDCTFRLPPHEKAKQNRNALISFPVLRRSLYSMKGPARTDWQHSIAPVSQTRYSITLRTLRTE